MFNFNNLCKQITWTTHQLIIELTNQEIKKPKIETLSRSGKIKKQLESIYLPKLKTQRVRKKLEWPHSKERKKGKSFEQSHLCKWVKVESCLLGQFATN